MRHHAPALAIAALALPLLGACKKEHYEYETRSPANAGMVEIDMKVDKTGNGDITLSFEHLAPPEHIDSSLRSYVVWVESGGKDPYKLGVLEYKAKKRSGSLSATYSDDQMKIIVTVEKDPKVDAPVGTRVLEADVIGPKP